MILGTILVILTWIVLSGVILVLGLAVSNFGSARGQSGLITMATVRSSLWWGLASFLIAILGVNLIFPLTGAAAAVAIAALLGLALIVLLLRRPRLSVKRPLATSWLMVVVIAVGAIAVIFLGFAALGPVTNYDSGLYHLGAIKYSGEFSTISGLANLYFPFGYNTSLYPFAAFLGNGPWSGEGYRLANGLIVALVVVDLVVRIIAARGSVKRLSAGSWILLVGTFIGLVPLVALSDYWVTSPSSDAPVMMLTFIACAYLADAILSQKMRNSDLATAFVISVVLFSLRPTMAVFLVGVTFAIALVLIRDRSNQSLTLNVFPLIGAGFVGILMLIVQTTRDYFLSGWFQFPLSLYSFNTPWTAIDPVWNRTATLGNARNPADIWGSVDGFAWVGPWIGRLPNQWEPYLILALALALIFLITAARLNRIRLRWRALGVILIPSALTTFTWFFFSPPAFRFAWGPVFSLLIIPIGVMLFTLARSNRNPTGLPRLAPLAALTLALGLVVVTSYTSVFRLPNLLNPQPVDFNLGPIAIGYQLTPVVDVPTQERVLSNGLVTTFPTESDQCWDNYPLCTPIVSESVRLRGEGIQNGFLP